MIAFLVTVVLSCLVLAAFALRRHLKGRVCRCTARLDGKTVLITGAERGIGKQTALELARRGARVVMACLDLELGLASAKEVCTYLGQNAGVRVRQLDLSDMDTVRTFAKVFLDEEERLDVLVNNAGVCLAKRQLSKQGLEIHFAINHLGHYLLTLLLLPLLRRSAPSRVITLSSGFHKINGIDFDDLSCAHAENFLLSGAYGKSKLCNVLFTRELARRLTGSGVSSFSLHPGVVRTGISEGIWSSFPIPGLRIFTWAISTFFFKTPWEGAQTTIHCALAKDLKSGDYFNDCRQEEIKSEQALDDEAARRLWQVSADLCGLKGEEALMKDE